MKRGGPSGWEAKHVTANLKTLGSFVLQPALPAILHTYIQTWQLLELWTTMKSSTKWRRWFVYALTMLRIPRNMLTFEILQSLHALCKWQVSFIKQEALEKAREIKVKVGSPYMFLYYTFIPREQHVYWHVLLLKADEEFNIEKVCEGLLPPVHFAIFLLLKCVLQAKIVRQESLNIEATFERKIKQAEVQKRMYAAHLLFMHLFWSSLMMLIIKSTNHVSVFFKLDNRCLTSFSTKLAQSWPAYQRTKANTPPSWRI